MPAAGLKQTNTTSIIPSTLSPGIGHETEGWARGKGLVGMGSGGSLRDQPLGMGMKTGKGRLGMGSGGVHS